MNKIYVIPGLNKMFAWLPCRVLLSQGFWIKCKKWKWSVQQTKRHTLCDYWQACQDYTRTSCYIDILVTLVRKSFIVFRFIRVGISIHISFLPLRYNKTLTVEEMTKMSRITTGIGCQRKHIQNLLLTSSQPSSGSWTSQQLAEQDIVQKICRIWLSWTPSAMTCLTCHLSRSMSSTFAALDAQTLNKWVKIHIQFLCCFRCVMMVLDVQDGFNT